MATWNGIVGRGFTADEFIHVYLASVKLGGWRPQFVVLHNTFSPTLEEWHSTPGEQRMRNLEVYYRDQQHWSGGPHLFVADDKIWAFTPLVIPGVHSPSWNRMSWGVELVGDYDAEPLGPGVKSNAIAALSGLHQLGGLDPQTLKLHHEDPKTTHKNCPGKNIVKADFIEWVSAALSVESNA